MKCNGCRSRERMCHFAQVKKWGRKWKNSFFFWHFAPDWVSLWLFMNEQVKETQGTAWLQRLLEWRLAHVSDKMFILILAFAVGFFAAVAAFVLHSCINLIVSLLTRGSKPADVDQKFECYSQTKTVGIPDSLGK